MTGTRDYVRWLDEHHSAGADGRAVWFPVHDLHAPAFDAGKALRRRSGTSRARRATAWWCTARRASGERAPQRWRCWSRWEFHLKHRWATCAPIGRWPGPRSAVSCSSSPHCTSRVTSAATRARTGDVRPTDRGRRRATGRWSGASDSTSMRSSLPWNRRPKSAGSRSGLNRPAPYDTAPSSR